LQKYILIKYLTATFSGGKDDSSPSCHYLT